MASKEMMTFESGPRISKKITKLAIEATELSRVTIEERLAANDAYYEENKDFIKEYLKNI